MSFVAITSTEIATGKPVASSTQSQIKNNFDNHETRITSLESGSATAYPPIILRVNGLYDSLSANTGILKTTANFALTITGVRVIVDQAGSSGTLTCDIKKSHSGGSYTSVLSTLPSVGYASGNDATSTNGVVNSSTASVAAGDILRLDTTGVQTGGRNFMVRIDYTKN